VRHVANSNIRTKAADKTLELSYIKLKALKFTKNHGFHGNQRFSRKEVNFMENFTAMKSWIKLVPSYVLACVCLWLSVNKTYSYSKHNVRISITFWIWELRKSRWKTDDASPVGPVMLQIPPAFPFHNAFFSRKVWTAWTQDSKTDFSSRVLVKTCLNYIVMLQYCV